MTIACDFDMVLSHAPYPLVGKPKKPLFDYLIRFRQNGGKVILWTCRVGKPLASAIEFCEGEGLAFDAVNANLPETIALYGSDSRKIVADIYIDDHAVHVDDFVKRFCKKHRSVRGIRIRG